MTTFSSKEKIVKWLTRLGVLEEEITFLGRKIITRQVGKQKYARSTPTYDTFEEAALKYLYQNKEFVLRCSIDKSYSENLKFLEILIHSRVIGIERGIEDMEKSFAGYAALTYASTPRGVLGLPETATRDECETAYRNLAKSLHSDVGGDDEQFAKINKAIIEIRGQK